MLQRKELTLDNQTIYLNQNLESVKSALQQLKAGKVKIILEAESTNLVSIKRRFFAMVSELAKFAGYCSHSDREKFKLFVKQHLGNESIRDMTESAQVSVKIEELHKLASEFYNYQFPNNDPDILTFHPKPD